MAVVLEEGSQDEVIATTTDPTLSLEATERSSSPPRAPRGVKFSVGDALEEVPSPSLETKAKLMAPVKPITLRIYTCLEDQVESITFPTGRYTTAGDIVSAMVQRLSLPEENKEVFSIWLISQYLQLQLKSYHVPVKLFKKWKEFLTQYTSASYEVCSSDQPILSFRRNAFFSLKEEKHLIAKKDSKVALSLLYHEAVHNVTSGRYPLSKEELIDLASIQCAVENQGYDEQRHTPESFKSNLNHFFPAYLIPASGSGVKNKLFGKSSKTVQLEEELVQEFKKTWERVSQGSRKRVQETSGANVEMSAVAHSLGKEEQLKLWQDIDLQLKLLYLQRCWIKPYYGCVMFRGQVERKINIKQLLTITDRNVIFAINPECVHLFSDSNPREILLYLTYDLFCWDFQPATEQGENFYSSLWLEFDSMYNSQKVAKRLQIFSRQAPMMDAMISRCVDELNKLDDEMKKQRIQKGGPEELPTHSITTGAALPNEKNFREDKLRCDMYTPDGEQVSALAMFRKKKISQDESGRTPPAVVNPTHSNEPEENHAP